jgi:hypothetical protein
MTLSSRRASRTSGSEAGRVTSHWVRRNSGWRGFKQGRGGTATWYVSKSSTCRPRIRVSPTIGFPKVGDFRKIEPSSPSATEVGLSWLSVVGLSPLQIDYHKAIGSPMGAKSYNSPNPRRTAASRTPGVAADSKAGQPMSGYRSSRPGSCEHQPCG